MNSLTDQAAQVLAEIDEQLAICEKDGELLPELAVDFEAAHSFEDSYGVPGSDWACCEICKAEDKPGIFSKGIPHEETCKVFRANRIIASARTVCPKSLRCLKTAIEGLLETKARKLEIYESSADKLAVKAGLGVSEWESFMPKPYHDNERLLTAVITQWNENK